LVESDNQFPHRIVTLIKILSVRSSKIGLQDVSN